MFVPIPTRVGRVKLIGVKDDAMYLYKLRTPTNRATVR